MLRMSNSNIINIVSGQTTVDTYLLHDDEEFIKFFRSLVVIGDDNQTMIEKLVNWVNDNY
tara:strand:- start:347 stop:526 length:180 start_codon:yes stop_codon:yes gene_type:complete